MTPFAVPEPTHIDEPQFAQQYADVLSLVAAQMQPVIVRRDREDLAAVVPLQFLEAIREAVAREEAERLAREMDWDHLVKESPPPQQWYEGDEPRPL